MTRPLRTLFEGAYYHVMNRGQDKRQIYFDERDYRTFLKIVKDACHTYQVQIVSYCLMNNHYHLLVHTPDANLPAFMRQVNGSYALFYNKRYKKDGPLFKGRYTAIVAQEGSYVLRVVRYIHRNPLKAGIVKKLIQYQWSSHPKYVEGIEMDWLKYKLLFKEQWKSVDIKNIKKEYLKFMLIDDKELEKYYEQKQKKAIQEILIGDENNQDKVKKAYLHSHRYFDEVPQAKALINESLVDVIKKETASIFKVDQQKLFYSRRGERNLPRMIAIGVTRELTGLKYRDIACSYNIKNYMTVKKCCERIKKKCRSNKEISRLFDGVLKRCRHVPT